jgi:hypothetical protein
LSLAIFIEFMRSVFLLEDNQGFGAVGFLWLFVSICGVVHGWPKIKAINTIVLSLQKYFKKTYLMKTKINKISRNINILPQ